MRHVWLFLATSVFTCGCAEIIAEAGTNLTGLQTKTDVHAELGKPIGGGSGPNGGSFEEYQTRRVISDHTRGGEVYVSLWGSTWGAVDLIYVPLELWLLGRKAVLGQNIRVTYDAADAVTEILLNGERLYPP
jgi:YD repeat-containing protein